MWRFDKRRAERGFTLIETLVTVLIIICLLAVSLVAVVLYRNYLRITELDNAAREIYMAAQNRAVLLDGRGSLERLVVKEDGSNQLEQVEISVGDGESVSMTLRYISSGDESIEQLLPAGTIEADLWNGQFYIVYEPESASVTDVFYAEETFCGAGDFAQFYEIYRGTAKRTRMKLSPMTGYYGGDSAQGGSTIALRTPVIRIFNEDTLEAEVTWWVPRSLQSELDQIEMKVTLSYEGQELLLDQKTLGTQYDSRVSDGTPENGTLYLMYSRTYLLDSLDTGLQFKDLLALLSSGTDGTDGAAGSAVPGGNFKLTAEVTYTGGTQVVNGAKKTAENNSLFAYDEENGDDTVAYIEYLRHLQNLRTAHSGVAGKTQAVQIADIDASYGGTGYQFLPVNNPELISYTVRQKSVTQSERFVIRDLCVDVTDEQYAGLFGDLSAQQLPDDSAVFTADGLRLVNASVKTRAADGCAGAVAGRADRTVFYDCRVYWEIDEEGQQNLRYLLGDNSSGYNYEVNASCAGGLAGQLANGGIVDSFAATMVSGTGIAGIAGGLVGKAEGIVAEHSYADCYISGGQAAGLAGELSGTGNKIRDCYTVGFLSGEAREGGLCLGAGGCDVSGSYSAMIYSVREDSDYSGHYPLCENTGTGYKDTHYLFSSYVNDSMGSAGGDDPYVVTHQALMGDGGSALTDLFGSATPFEMITVSESHPYNLQTGFSLSGYPYPAFPEMGHYGDWAAEFSEGSLVYWEQYESSEYRFQGANLNLLLEEMPVGDGYAVVLKAEKGQEQKEITIQYTYMTAEGEKQMTVFYSLSGASVPDEGLDAVDTLQTAEDGTDTYYLALLPEEIVCSAYASGDFYQKISFLIMGEGSAAEYYYSPHFAATMLEYDEKSSASGLAKDLTVRIRTPRHLYELSRHAEYYASTLGLVFQQELDLDYGKYSAYQDEDDPGLYRTENGAVQGTIGKNAGSPFRCVYRGGCHVIANVAVKADGSFYGLFGYNTGIIRDVVYLSTSEETRIVEKTVTEHSTVYAGGLVGNNSGTVSNCAVADMAFLFKAFGYSTLYAGGLVGVNYGTVTGSSAALKYIDAETTYSNAYLGGFAGRNAAGGSIRNCYATGRVSAARSHWGNVYAAGFAGSSLSVVRNCYAATALTVSGEAVAYGFCSDNTSSSNFYLNGGTYRYSGGEYALQYEDGGSSAKAQPMTYTPMTDGKAAGKLGFSKNAPKYDSGSSYPYTYTYPYPAVVQNADGKVIHYGQWPEMLSLGTVGVCYWEKEVTLVGNETYHFSAIVAIPDDDGKSSTISRISTLCTEHDDGGVIKEYGYGYLYDGEEPKLDVTDTANAEDAYIDTEASEALKKQTENRYQFIAFATRQTDESGDTGLYLTGNKRSDVWSLSMAQQDVIYRFNVSPFFGDALSYNGGSGLTINIQSDVPVAVPGSVETVPYQVRTVRQLSYINWNYEEKDTDTVLTYDSSTGKGTREQFPYLSYYMNRLILVKDFWKQTHDLDGEHGTYSPIAEFYDTAAGNKNTTPANLWGWFGGTYDGSDYTIADLNIQGHEASCVGLFGAVYNGTLKNIVLYSSDGEAAVTSSAEALSSCWFAMGALAGLAASDTGSAVVNCSVAGYTILDQHYLYSGSWGGSGIGGLLGISNMQLSGCSAVTTMVIDATDNDNMRIGGLVGACQQSISDSYTGGEIIFKKGQKAKGVFIGGIVGGMYMRRLKVGASDNYLGGSGTLQNALYNCYSYAVLPEAEDEIKGLYAIGGAGDIDRNLPGDELADYGTTTYSNCYYLRDTVLSKNGGSIPDVTLTDMKENSEVEAFTYEQMSDGKLLNALNAKSNGAFSAVTTRTQDGNVIDGKYSFAVSRTLNGLNYPFPAVLTQENTSYASGRVYVHYGDWPLNGIERENGSLPIDIDVFADYQEAVTDASGEVIKEGAAEAEEKVWLSSLVQSAGTGTFTVTCVNAEGDETGGGESAGEDGTEAGEDTGEALSVAEAFFRTADGDLKKEYRIEDTSEQPMLVVRGLREGMALVTVSYWPDNGVIIAPLTVTVNVTAQLQLRPGEENGQDEDILVEEDSIAGTQITMLSETVVFTNERSDTSLYSFDINGDALPDSLKEQISLNVTGVSSVEDAYLSEASAANVYGEDGVTQIPCRGLLTTVSRQLAGSTTLIVEYEYTYKEKTYEASSTVNIAVKELVAKAESAKLYLDEEAGRTLTYGWDGFSFRIDGVLEEGIEPEIGTIYNGNTGIAYAVKNEDGTLQVTAGGMSGPTTAILTLQFTYGGSSHTVTVDLEMIVYETRMALTSDEINDGVLYLYSGSADRTGAEITAQLSGQDQGAEFQWELSQELAAYVELQQTSSDGAVLSQTLETKTQSAASEDDALLVEQETAAQEAEVQSAISEDDALLVIEETETQAAASDSEMLSPTVAADAQSAASDSVVLSLTQNAETLTAPVYGYLTLTAALTAWDGSGRTSTRRISVCVEPDMQNDTLTAYLAAEDEDGVLYAQKLEAEKEKEKRQRTLSEGETVEPYIELEVQDTALNAVEVTIPLGGVVPEDGSVEEVESFYLAALPRRAVSTVEDQLEEHPELEASADELQNLLLPEDLEKAAGDWTDEWKDYQVTGYSLEKLTDEPDDDGQIYIKLVFDWSVYHTAGACTVTYRTELLPEDLIRVKPDTPAAEEKWQIESAGVDENGVAVYELDLEATEKDGIETDAVAGTEGSQTESGTEGVSSGTGTEDVTIVPDAAGETAVPDLEEILPDPGTAESQGSLAEPDLSEEAPVIIDS